MAMKQFCKNKIKLSIFLATYIYANTLDEININAVQNIDYLEFSNTIYNKAYLNTQIKQNHTLDELIKNHTNIRITTKDSDNSNSLKPDDFSINGAKTYQNQMFIDGINITSTIQPAMSKTLYKNVWYNPSLGSYSLNIDSEIIDNLSIYDSFVSASYGGFLGGVIDAKIKSPSKNPIGGFSLGYSFQDNIFIDDKIRQKYSSGYGYQDFSNYYKRYFSANFSSYLNDTFGILFFVSSNYSNTKIKQKDIYTINKISDTNNLILLKTQKDYDNHILSSTFIYNPYLINQFQEGVIDSNMKVNYGGFSLAFNLESELKNINLNQHLSFLKSNSSRIYDKKVQYQFILPSGIKQSYGGLGDTLQTEKSYQYKLDAKTNEFKNNDLEYSFNFGFELSKNQGKINRINPYTRYEKPIDILACKENDISCINNQYFSYYETHFAKAKKSINNYAQFIQSDIKYHNFRFRLGLRNDYDSLSKRFNIAPRTGLEYYLNDNQFLGFGFNKYYDKGLLAYILYDDYFSGYEEYSRIDYNSPWIQDTKWQKDRVFMGLKSPYANEFSLYYNAEFKYFKMLLKYIKRKTYNEIYSANQEELGLESIKDTDNNYKVYYNGKKTANDIVSLNLSSNEISIFNTKNYFDLNLSYLHKKGSATNYLSTTGKNIIYNGKTIKSSELPFVYEPFIANFTHNLFYDNFNLINEITYHSAKNDLYSQYDKNLNMQIFSDTKLKSYLNWNLGFGYTKNIKNTKLKISFNILNILNSKNKINVFNCNNELCYKYANSRLYTFNLNYNF